MIASIKEDKDLIVIPKYRNQNNSYKLPESKFWLNILKKFITSSAVGQVFDVSSH